MNVGFSNFRYTETKVTIQLRDINKKWTRKDKKNVIYCYFESKSTQRGYRKEKLVTIVEGDPKAPFSIVGEGATPFPGLLNFAFDPYLIVLSGKQGGIK